MVEAGTVLRQKELLSKAAKNLLMRFWGKTTTMHEPTIRAETTVISSCRTSLKMLFPLHSL